ncbi:MAG: hypothetical protein ACOX66_07570 [Oscillospiraceae bacterium]
MTNVWGGQYKLPQLLEWNFSYGAELPCDAFEVTFLFDAAMYPVLRDAVRFYADEDGKTVFTGLVDDFEISVSERGSVAVVHGRGMAALLLDNEAGAAQYYSASLEMVLSGYVYPFGITNVKNVANISPQSLNVESGESCWKVLEDFVWFGCGVKPRFDVDGTLLLGRQEGAKRVIDANTAVSSQTLKRRRYGVISEVIVKNKAAGTSTRVVNEAFRAQGGQCRRVVNVPRRTLHNAMRATGEYQIARSMADSFSITLTLPALFAAFPGDVVTLAETPTGAAGTYDVIRATCFADGEQAGTEIILKTRGE